jgi:Na+/H+ antiporter NhaC
MNRLGGVIRRLDFGLQAVVPLVTFVFAWWMGWSVFVAIGAFVAAAIVTAILRPRRPGRWTE